MILFTRIKATVLSLLFVLAGSAAGEVYTWDFSTNGPFIGGTVSTHQKNSITIEDAEINGVATRALVYPTTYCEKGSEVLYNMLECAALGETIRFSMDVYWDGTQKDSHWHTFLHVGPAGYGITLGMNGYGQLTFANQNNYDEDLIESAQLTAQTWNSVVFTLASDKTFISVNGNTYQGNDITWDDMAWATIDNPDYRFNYSMGCRASGKYDDNRILKGVKIANLRVECMPEPSTVSLSLFAITILTTMRRRV